MPRYVDIDPHGRVRVFHSFATEICYRDLEESGQLLGVAGQATDPAIRVVQDRQVSPAGPLASAEAAEQCPRAQGFGGNSAADVAHHDCLTELESEHVAGVNPRVDTPDHPQCRVGREGKTLECSAGGERSVALDELECVDGHI